MCLVDRNASPPCVWPFFLSVLISVTSHMACDMFEFAWIVLTWAQRSNHHHHHVQWTGLGRWPPFRETVLVWSPLAIHSQQMHRGPHGPGKLARVRGQRISSSIEWTLLYQGCILPQPGLELPATLAFPIGYHHLGRLERLDLHRAMADPERFFDISINQLVRLIKWTRWSSVIAVA